MDTYNTTVKEDFDEFITYVKKLLPKKKIRTVSPDRTAFTRLREINVEAKSVFPQCFMGARLFISSQMLDKVKLTQQYNFGSSKKSYKSYQNFIHKELTPKHLDGLLIETTGSATATYTEKLDDLELRLTTKINNLVSSELEVLFEKTNNDISIGSLSLVLKDVNPSSLKFITQYMHKITPVLSIGCEIGVQPFRHSFLPILSLCSRYVHESYTLTTTLARTGIQFCLYKKLSPDLRIASIISETPSTPLTLSLAINKHYENGSKLNVFVNSRCCGGFTFQKDVLFYEPQNDTRTMRLMFSTLIDRQRKLQFGFGFNLDF